MIKPDDGNSTGEGSVINSDEDNDVLTEEEDNFVVLDKDIIVEVSFDRTEEHSKHTCGLAGMLIKQRD